MQAQIKKPKYCIEVYDNNLAAWVVKKYADGLHEAVMEFRNLELKPGHGRYRLTSPKYF